VKLVIRSDTTAADSVRVELDGRDLTGSLTNISLSMGVGQANFATLRLICDRVEVDAEALAKLEIVESGPSEV
jgi:outer membrane receptor protein involved in Fe transport